MAIEPITSVKNPVIYGAKIEGVIPIKLYTLNDVPKAFLGAWSTTTAIKTGFVLIFPTIP